MAITLVGILDSTEGTQTIAFAENITDRYFNHENMVNTSANENKLGNTSSSSKISINEYLYQRSYKPYFFTCGTAADTAAKAITGASGWGLSSTDLVKIWPLVRVKFTNTNTVANPTLNINNTGAKPIYYGGSTISATNAGILKGIVTLMYNGTTSGSEYWDFISGDTTTFTNEVSASDNILHGSSSGSEITYAPYSSETADSTWVGTDGNGGKLYLGDVDPSKTNRLNLNGYLYAKKLYSDGTEVKVKQDAVSDPSANGNSTSFIATISQDTNGVITVTKKNLGTATINTAGAIKVGAVKNSAVTNASTDDTNTEKRYSVLIDSTGLAYTNVPWTDNNTTYSSGNEITISNSNAINHNVKLSGGFTPTTTGATISGYGASGSFKVPVLTVNDYGHVTNASEATVSITLPDNKITTYTAPTYDTAHVSPAYQTIITNNAIAVNTIYDAAINKLDNKIAGLTKEVIDDEAVLSQAIEDEPRYYAKSTTSTVSSGTAALTATIVENRSYRLLNGTKLDIFFQNDQTVSTCTLNVSGSNGASGAHYLVYENALFDASLIKASTTLALVYDSATVTIGGTNYSGVYRVVGGVGSGGSTDTKNTAGSTDIEHKIYLVGVQTKADPSGDPAVPDEQQSYTNGECYISTDGWLYSSNKKCLVDGDLQSIYDALSSMEIWPTVVSTQNDIHPTTLAVTTNAVPNSINTYYKVGSTVMASGGVYQAGGALAVATDISVNVSVTFTPNTNETYVAQNVLSNMTYGYKDALSDETKHTQTTKTTSANVSPTFTRINNTNTSSTTLILYKKVNTGSYSAAKSVNNSGGSTTIKITSGESLGTLAEGTTKFQLKYTNTSTISRSAKSYSIDGVNAFYSSNINNFNSQHEGTVAAYSGSLPAVGSTYATGSTSGTKTGDEFTVYAVYPLYTNGSATSASAITGSARTSGSTGGASTYNAFSSLVNYAQYSSRTYYVSFGQIMISDNTIPKAYIYVPNVSGGRNVTLTACEGANSSTGSYDTGTIPMAIELVSSSENINGYAYKKYWIKNPTGSTSEGANSYKLTITASNA